MSTISISLSGGGSGAKAYCCYVDASTTRLFIGGNFDTVTVNGTSQTCNNIAYLQDNSLNAFALITPSGSNGLNNTVYSIRGDPSVPGKILIGGEFVETGPGGLTTALGRVAFAALNGSNWDFSQGPSVGSIGPLINNEAVFDVIKFNNGTTDVLVIGGSFTQYDGTNACKYIIGYNLSSGAYLQIGNPGGSFGYEAFNGTVKCFEYVSSQNNLYVGGSFTTVAGNSRQNCTYFASNDLTTAEPYDFPTTCESIYYNPTQAIIWRGGGSQFGINTSFYTGSQLSNGLTINYKNAFFYRVGFNVTYFVNQAGGNGAYIYDPASTYTQWSLPIDNPVWNATITGFTYIKAPDKGDTFTLIGTLIGGTGISGPYWYQVANRNCEFS